MTAVTWRAAATRALDVAVVGSAAVVATVAIERSLRHGHDLHPRLLVAIVLLAVMGRYPLVLSNKAGDAVIAFEASVLVFLACTYPPRETLAVWSVGMVLEHSFQRRPARVRAFNVGLTISGGAVLVALTSLVGHAGPPRLVELAVVMAACAAYFAFDMLLTGVWLAAEARTSLASALEWATMPLGLLAFVAVDSIGYLAVVLDRTAPPWTLLLLLVPISTILLAVDAVSRARLSEQRLAALFQAAADAPDWTDVARLERTLIERATTVLRHTTAELRSEPAGHDELGCVVQLTSGEVRQLVVRRAAHAQPFDEDDRRALDALTALVTATLDRHRLTDQMTHLAGHDPLTGLANRRVFGDALEHALAGAGDDLVAVLFCDLDGFKAVNDRYGHHAGDALLVDAADRLRACLAPGDLLARLGGDEFAVLLAHVGAEADALAVAEAIHGCLGERFVLDGGDAQVGVSIGVAVAAPEDAGTDVLRNADTAMYRAKSLGKGRTERFEPLMRVDVLNRLELEEQLRSAIVSRSLGVLYQPIIDLATGAVDGFEALSRWTHPTLGVITPDVFIPTADRLGLIGTLDAHVLETAHRQVRDLMRRTGRPLSLSVNVTPSQVGDPRLLAQVGALLAAEPAMPLILELTEQTLLADDPETLQALRRLTDTGARLAVDDFGAGYSSIGYLHRLPVDRVKIDRSLVQDLAVRRSYLLVQGVVAMARAMDLQVVVEGVEDAPTAIALRDLGCDRAQGYLFGRPMTLRAAEALLRAHTVPGWADVGLTPRATPQEQPALT